MQLVHSRAEDHGFETKFKLFNYTQMKAQF